MSVALLRFSGLAISKAQALGPLVVGCGSAVNGRGAFSVGRWLELEGQTAGPAYQLPFQWQVNPKLKL